MSSTGERWKQQVFIFRPAAASRTTRICFGASVLASRCPLEICWRKRLGTSMRSSAEDIAILTAHFAAKYPSQFGRTVSRVDRRTLALLESYLWPGNVRELENRVARAIIVADGEVLRFPRHMFPGRQPPRTSTPG
jgi:hypothetical protein